MAPLIALLWATPNDDSRLKSSVIGVALILYGYGYGCICIRIGSSYTI